jgi:hypothetical protein
MNEGHPMKNGNLASENIEASTVKKVWWPRLPFAALLIIFTVSAYLPSLDKVFTFDQMSYFLELNGETSLASGFRLFDYEANRQYGKGDEVLYRPLLFTVLALENTLFHRDFRLWNIANLVFHLLVAYLLFEVLWRIKPSLLACGVALLFGLLASNFEMVTRNHRGGYMLGYGLLLVALWAARKMGWDKGCSGIRWFWIYGLAMTSAMLFHEIAVIAGFGVIAYVSWCRRKKLNTKWGKLIAATCAPILIYVMLYSFHVSHCNRFLWVDTHGVVSSPIERLVYLPSLILYWLQHIFLPLSGQLVFSYMGISSWTLPYGALIPEVFVPGALWIGILICLRQGFERKYMKEFFPFAALIFSLIVSYAGIVLLGRFHRALEEGSHYDYFPALFGAVLLYSFVDFSRVRRTSKLVAIACLLLLTLNNGLEVRNMSCRIQELYSPVSRYLEWVEQTVRPKISSPDFSFAIKGVPPELNIPLWAWVGYPDQGCIMDLSLFDVLYGKYYNSVTPRYILVVRDIRTGKIDTLTEK